MHDGVRRRIGELEIENTELKEENEGLTRLLCWIIETKTFNKLVINDRDKREMKFGPCTLVREDIPATHQTVYKVVREEEGSASKLSPFSS
jgi:hypothetical protein